MWRESEIPGHGFEFAEGSAGTGSLPTTKLRRVERSYEPGDRRAREASRNANGGEVVEVAR